MVSSISIKDLLDKIGSILIIDIRSVEKYNDNHIDGAINIPFEKLILDPKYYLNYKDTYYLYCQKGSKSISACMYLAKRGFKVVNIKEGYEGWIMEK